ncbi:helix-turn-helix domain-containing protein [Luteolibacter marinus]|uniref:helix-turn-helix domain-containing protein n=1 Tax=Luteolibacter marinus TaxID=2776705 RepID=UPI0031BA66B2
MGRPSRYREEFAEQARKLCRLGATDKELAEFFGVDVATLNRWKQRHAEFCESLKDGKCQADAEVADRLFKRATGYSHEDTKILQNNGAPVIVPTVKHYPPDTVACIFWLKNRRPDLWRDKVGLEHSGPNGGPIPTEGDYRPSAEDEEVIRRIAETRAKITAEREGPECRVRSAE